MVDITITAASVAAGSNATTEHGTAGAAITAGQVVYKSATTKKFLLADNDSATAGVRDAYGIALNTANADGQPITVQKSGLITLGGTLVAGTTYCLSETPGGIETQASVGVGNYVVALGQATSTTVLNLDITNTGVAL